VATFAAADRDQTGRFGAEGDDDVRARARELPCWQIVMAIGTGNPRRSSLKRALRNWLFRNYFHNVGFSKALLIRATSESHGFNL